MENSSFATNLQAGLRILLGVFSFVMAFLLIGPGTRFHVSFETEKGSVMSPQNSNNDPQPADASFMIPTKPTTEVFLTDSSLQKGPSSPPSMQTKGPSSPPSTPLKNPTSPASTVPKAPSSPATIQNPPTEIPEQATVGAAPTTVRGEIDQTTTEPAPAP